MLMNRYLHRYICEQYPKLGEVLKIDNHNMIYKKYINKIYEDNELTNIWEELIKNMDNINEIAQKKYIKKTNSNYEENKKIYKREYYKDYYKTHEKYREYKKNYNKKLFCFEKENDKLRREIEKLKEVINNISYNITSINTN